MYELKNKFLGVVYNYILNYDIKNASSITLTDLSCSHIRVSPLYAAFGIKGNVRTISNDLWGVQQL